MIDVCTYCHQSFEHSGRHQKFCSRACYEIGRKKPPNERFWTKVDKNGPVPTYRPDLGPCWIWTGSRDAHDYGQFYANGSKVLAHRYAYETGVGPIPEGLEPDHLCRVHPCIRPSHLEPVTRRENLRRGQGLVASKMAQTHCEQGHEFTPDNTYLWRERRHCRACRAKHSAAAEQTRPDRSAYFREYFGTYRKKAG
jgi:hypothetical protein